MIKKIQSEYFLEAIYSKIGEKLKKRRIEVNMILESQSKNMATIRAELLQRWLKELLQMDFKPCPLDVQKTGEIDMGDYIIEKILYQVFPGSFVPANVYRPKQVKEKLPAVLVPMGHWPAGKAQHENQIYCANLCLNSFVVLTFDPQYQGERSYLEDDFSDLEREDYICVSNHMKAALPQYLLGKQFASNYIWDGMRGIDYLCEREDVDTERIGCTGQSGGGTQTSLIMAIDKRIKAASIIQYLTSAEEDLHYNGVGDAEQAAFGLQSLGFDKADFAWMIAPRPILINSALHDEIFPIEGVLRLKDELRRLYDLYDMPECLELVMSDSGHEIHKDTREGCYYWMNKWLRKTEGFLLEREVKILSQEELSAGYAIKNRFDVIDWNIQTFTNIRKGYSQNPENEIRNALINFFVNIRRESFKYYPIEEGDKDDMPYKRFRIITEKSYDIDCTFFHRVNENKRLWILLDMENGGFDMGSLIGDENVLELRPFGSCYTSRQNKKIRFDTQAKAVQTIFASGTDMISLRVNEILCAIEYMNLTYGKPSEIIFETTGQGGILALVAGLFEDNISEINMDRILVSYEDIVNQRNVFINDSDIIVGFLKKFDLIDLMRANKEKKLRLKNPVDAFGNIIKKDEAERFFRGYDYIGLN